MRRAAEGDLERGGEGEGDVEIGGGETATMPSEGEERDVDSAGEGEADVESGGGPIEIAEREEGDVESTGEGEGEGDVERGGGETATLPAEGEERDMESAGEGEGDVENTGDEIEIVEEEEGDMERGGEGEGDLESGPSEIEIAEGDVEIMSAQGDVETEEGEIENLLQMRWPFIRKVYSIVTVQLLLSIAVASVIVSVPPIARFFSSSILGSFLNIFFLFLPTLRFLPLKYYSVLFTFTVAVAFGTGMECATQSRKVILEEVIVTTAVVLSVTLSTFWAARRGIDFNFLRPYLAAAFVVSILFAFIQEMLPLGISSVILYGCLSLIIYGGYIIYDTDNMIKRLSYDQLIWVAFSLYMNIVQLFESVHTLLTRSL